MPLVIKIFLTIFGRLCKGLIMGMNDINLFPLQDFYDFEEGKIICSFFLRKVKNLYPQFLHFRDKFTHIPETKDRNIKYFPVYPSADINYDLLKAADGEVVGYLHYADLGGSLSYWVTWLHWVCLRQQAYRSRKWGTEGRRITILFIPVPSK